MTRDGGEEKGAVKFGTTLIEYTVTRSRRRRKTIQITLDHGEGVLVAAPVRASPEQIRQVVLKRATWIVQRAGDEVLRPRRKELVSGESLPYLGRQARLFVRKAAVRRTAVGFEHWAIHVTVPLSLDGEERRASIEAALRKWYKERAGEQLGERTDHWAKVAGFQPTGVLIRDQRQRWGSCSPDGTLRFNWRIVMAAPTLIDYVVVHELVHLRVRTHSPAFWAELGRLMPDYGIRRSLLKEQGLRLTL